MPNVSGSKRGFTLFELLLVVVLIAVLYGVFVGRLTSRPGIDEAQERVTLATIRDYLRHFSDGEKEVSLICPEPCERCSVYAGDKEIPETDVALFQKTPIVYHREVGGHFEPFEFLPVRRKEGALENVCFSFTLRPNGSSSSYIVEMDDVYYLFDAYLRPTRTFASLEEAESAYRLSELLPDDKRTYDF
jgi:prepilin-type N-terminal cleavage/methylation domain-containing protein